MPPIFGGGPKKQQMYGNLEWFLPTIMHCLGWCHIMTPICFVSWGKPEFRGDMHDELDKISPLEWFVDRDFNYLFHLFQENLPCQDAIEATGFVVPILIRWVSWNRRCRSWNCQLDCQVCNLGRDTCCCQVCAHWNSGSKTCFFLLVSKSGLH